MKKIVLLLLLLSIAAATVTPGTPKEKVFIDLEKSTIREDLIAPYIYIDGTKTIYDLRVNFTAPAGIELEETKQKKLPYMISEGKVRWRIKTNLTESELEKIVKTTNFKIGWDNDIPLRINRVNNEQAEEYIKISEKEVKIEGVTETQGFYATELTELKNRYPDKEEDYLRTVSDYFDEKKATRVKIVIGDKEEEVYAAPDGSFEAELTLSKDQMRKNLTAIITATDPGGNQNKKELTLYYDAPLDTIVFEYIWVLAGIVVFIILLIIIAIAAYIIYGKRRQQVAKKKSYEETLERRRELQEKLEELEKKKFTHGQLGESDKKKKKTYEKELEHIQEDLLKNKRHLKRIYKRTHKVIEQSKEGIPSSIIKKQLEDEGYTQKEIEVIKRLFKKKKAQIKASEKP